MTMIVLMGAGASHGSVGVEPYKPPLGNELFNNLLKRGGIAENVPAHIKMIFEGDFEKGMAEFIRHSDNHTMLFQRELAGYLAKFQPSNESIYIKLIEALKGQRVIYSSLNYDLLFEQSAEKLGLRTAYSSDHYNGCVSLLKIHGSSNFWPKLPTGMFKGCTIGGNSRDDIVSKIITHGRTETLIRCAEEDSIAPAMAMFAVGKERKIGREHIDKQYNMWKEEVIKSSHIFIIGVRVHEVDDHIWGVLGKSKSKITYFGFNGDKAEFEQWKSNHNKKNAYFINSNFENSIKVLKRLSKE